MIADINTTYIDMDRTYAKTHQDKSSHHQHEPLRYFEEYAQDEAFVIPQTIVFTNNN